MKHLLITIFSLFIIHLNAQSPSAFNYQALALDNSDNIYSNQLIDIQISILEGAPNGPAVFIEEHQVTTSGAGIFSLQIGRGTALMGAFPSTWGANKYFLDVDADFDGNGYQDMGTTELLSVPYAIHAETVTNKNDADADPQNEIQLLTLNNQQLSLSQSNQVDLSPLASPWKKDISSSDIFYNEGTVRVDDGDDQIEINALGISGESKSGDNVFILEKTGILFGDAQTSVNTKMDDQEFNVYDAATDQISTQTVVGFGIYQPECQTELQNGILAMQDTLGFANTFYSKDSLYYYRAAGNLAYPDIAKLKPTHIEFETLGLGFRSTLRPGAQRNFSDNYASEFNSNSVRIWETTQPIPFDRVIVSGDSLNIWNSAKWRTVDIQSDNTLGGTIDLNNASGTSLVEIGAIKDDIFGFPPTGNILLKDDQGLTRNTSGVTQGNGFNLLEGDGHYVFSGLGSVITGKLTGPKETQILNGYAMLNYDTATNSGEVELYAGESPESIAYLGHRSLDHESGRLALFSNGFGNKENVSLEASRDLGGQFHLFSKNLSTNFYAGGSDFGGIAFVADSSGSPIAGMETTDWQGGRVYVRNDGSFAVEGKLGTNELANLNRWGLLLSDSSGNAASWTTRDIDFTNAGVQWLWGANGGANVYLGLDRYEGELGPTGNYGKIELFDADANVRAWMSGTGQMAAASLSIEDVDRVSKINAGTLPFDNSAFFELFGANDFPNFTIHGSTSGNHGSMAVHDANGFSKAGVFVDENTGLGHVFGDVKNFRMDHPSDPEKEIWYASLEGPEAAAYVRGTAHLDEGEAFVPFPVHFQEVCNSETITIQLTPRHWDTYGLAVVEITQNGFFVKELKGAAGSFDFDWEAKGVRTGFENYKAVLSKSDLPDSLINKNSR